MESIAERAVDGWKESNKMTTKMLDEIIPAYFFLGYTLGEGKVKFDKIKDKEISSMLTELYNQGKKVISESTKTKECPKCHKEISGEEETKFCQFCGAELNFLSS